MSTGSPLTIRLHPHDNIVVARVDLQPGDRIPEERVICEDAVPAGHKLAATEIDVGSAVRKYGQIIGFARRAIRRGEHVHTHNLATGDYARDYAVGEDVRPVVMVPQGEQATFQGIVRADGLVGTRNYIGVISTVNCASSVARFIAESVTAEELSVFANVDGIVPLCHSLGCGAAGAGEGFDILQRTMAGYAAHPNFAAVLLIGLGCEVNQIDALLNNYGLRESARLRTMTIQDAGGTQATVREGVDRIRAMLPVVNRIERQTLSAGHLVLGLECGGSDAYSGITANPALGAAVDLLVRHGGTAILGETPEIYGAEHLLTRRAVSPAVGQKLIDRLRWWEAYTARGGAEMDNNPTPGNREGGLTTILEKSLGAAAKGGTTDLEEVYGYAEPVRSHGFVFMDTPGYDPPSVTGMVAGGANVVCFTTGRGSVFGCKPVPVIKLASNTPMYQRLEDDMDINCGLIVDGKATLEEMGEEIFRMILAVASGQRSKSEMHGMGGDEFVPWHVGAVM
jgi:altronate hydrolase